MKPRDLQHLNEIIMHQFENGIDINDDLYNRIYKSMAESYYKCIDNSGVTLKNFCITFVDLLKELLLLHLDHAFLVNWLMLHSMFTKSLLIFSLSYLQIYNTQQFHLFTKYNILVLIIIEHYY